MSTHLTVGSGLHRIADAIFAMVEVIREGIAEDKAWRASVDEKRPHPALTDGGSPHA